MVEIYIGQVKGIDVSVLPLTKSISVFLNCFAQDL